HVPVRLEPVRLPLPRGDQELSTGGGPAGLGGRKGSVAVEGLTKEFPGGVRALDGLDLSIVDGEFFALLGPSGCGKTTLLRTIAGRESPTSGTVRIGDRDVTVLAPGARNVAMVFQDYALFPHMTVRENIAYPLKIKHEPRVERSAKAGAVGAQLGLADLMPR